MAIAAGAPMTQAPMTEDKHESVRAITQSPFFKLPLELRLAIYEEVLLTTSTFDHDEDPSGTNRIYIGSKNAAPPSLLQVCQAVRAESTPLFLKNKFQVLIEDYNTTRADAWFAFFPQHHLARIDLRIEWLWFYEWSVRSNMILPLLEKGFKGQSYVLRPEICKQWKPKVHDSQSLLTLMGDMHSSRQNKRLLTNLKSLSAAMFGLRESGLTRDKVAPILKAKMDGFYENLASLAMAEKIPPRP